MGKKSLEFMDKDLFHATILDFLGVVVFLITITMSKYLCIIFPMTTYFAVWKHYEKDFWKAYAISLGSLVVIVFITVFVISFTPAKDEVLVSIYYYVKNNLSLHNFI